MTETSTGGAQPRRPATGVPIDPARLTAWRQARSLGRQELSDRIAALGWTDRNDKPVTLTSDAIAKIENSAFGGGPVRQPRGQSIRAICEVLRIQPDYLLPTGPRIEDVLAAEEAARRRVAGTILDALEDDSGHNSDPVPALLAS